MNQQYIFISSFYSLVIFFYYFTVWYNINYLFNLKKKIFIPFSSSSYDEISIIDI